MVSTHFWRAGRKRTGWPYSSMTLAATDSPIITSTPVINPLSRSWAWTAGGRARERRLTKRTESRVVRRVGVLSMLFMVPFHPLGRLAWDCLAFAGAAIHSCPGEEAVGTWGIAIPTP